MKISILKTPLDTLRPLCAARLLAMGINSNGTPREMRGVRREEEEEEEARGEDETPMTSKLRVLDRTGPD